MVEADDRTQTPDFPARDTLDAQTALAFYQEAMSDMFDLLDDDVEAIASDLFEPDERILALFAGHPTKPRHFLACSERSVVLFKRDRDGALSIRVLALAQIEALDLRPLTGQRTGALVLRTVSTSAGPAFTFPLETHFSYYRVVALTRLMRRLQAGEPTDVALARLKIEAYPARELFVGDGQQSEYKNTPLPEPTEDTDEGYNVDDEANIEDASLPGALGDAISFEPQPVDGVSDVLAEAAQQAAAELAESEDMAPLSTNGSAAEAGEAAAVEPPTAEGNPQPKTESPLLESDDHVANMIESAATPFRAPLNAVSDVNLPTLSDKQMRARLRMKESQVAEERHTDALADGENTEERAKLVSDVSLSAHDTTASAGSEARRGTQRSESSRDMTLDTAAMHEPWFLYRGAAQHGPYPFEQLKEWFETGKLGASEFVRSRSMSQWVRVHQVFEA